MASEDKISLSTDQFRKLMMDMLSSTPPVAPQGQDEAPINNGSEKLSSLPNPADFGAPVNGQRQTAPNTQLGMIGQDVPQMGGVSQQLQSPQQSPQGNVSSSLQQAQPANGIDSKSSNGQILPTLQQQPTGSRIDKVTAVGNAQRAEAVDKEFAAKGEQGKIKSELDSMLDAHDLAKKTEAVKIAQQYSTDSKALASNFENEIAGQLDEYHKAVTDLASSNPNPWADRGTGWAISSALFAAVNQLGMGLAGQQGPNQVLQQINQTLDRDMRRMELQQNVKKDSLNAQGNLLQHMQGIYKDKQQALAATRVAALDLVSAQFDMQLAKTAPQQRNLEAGMYKQGIEAEKQKAYQQLTDKTIESNQRSYGLDLQRLNIETTAAAKAAGQERPGLFGELKDKTLIKDASNTFNAIHDGILPGLSALKTALGKKVGFTSPFDLAANYEEVTQAKEQVIKAINEAKAGGRVSKYSTELNQAAAGLSKWTGKDMLTNKDAAKRADEGINAVVKKLQGALKEQTGKPYEYWAAKLGEQPSQGQ